MQLPARGKARAGGARGSFCWDKAAIVMYIRARWTVGKRNCVWPFICLHWAGPSAFPGTDQRHQGCLSWAGKSLLRGPGASSPPAAPFPRPRFAERTVRSRGWLQLLSAPGRQSPSTSVRVTRVTSAGAWRLQPGVGGRGAAGTVEGAGATACAGAGGRRGRGRGRASREVIPGWPGRGVAAGPLMPLNARPRVINGCGRSLEPGSWLGR